MVTSMISPSARVLSMEWPSTRTSSNTNERMTSAIRSAARIVATHSMMLRSRLFCFFSFLFFMVVHLRQINCVMAWAALTAG